MTFRSYTSYLSHRYNDRMLVSWGKMDAGRGYLKKENNSSKVLYLGTEVTQLSQCKNTNNIPKLSYYRM
jgi:hypothetical protein